VSINKLVWRSIVVVVVLVVVCAAIVYGMAHYDVQVAADKAFGEHLGPVHVRFVRGSLSRTHGIWLSWRLTFSRQAPFMPGDRAAWHLFTCHDTCSFRDVDFYLDH